MMKLYIYILGIIFGIGVLFSSFGIIYGEFVQRPKRELENCKYILKHLYVGLKLYKLEHDENALIPSSFMKIKGYNLKWKNIQCPVVKKKFNTLLNKKKRFDYILYNNLSQNYKDKLKLKGIDKNKEIWVIDKPGNHPSNKINVLYSDGTVQTVEYELKK